MKSKLYPTFAAQLQLFVFALAIITLSGATGCYTDYSPMSERIDSPTTVSIEEEDRLIERGTALLQELGIEAEIISNNAAKSVEQVRADQAMLTPQAQFVAEPLPNSDWLPAEKLPFERWEVQYYHHEPLGYLHQYSRASDVGGEQRIVTEIDAITRSRTGDLGDEQNINMLLIEGTNGRFKSIDYKVQSSKSLTTVKAIVITQELRVTVKGPGKNEQKVIEWDESIRGPMAVEQSLLREMIDEGENRSLSVFDPTVADVVKVQLLGRGFTRVPTLGGVFAQLMEVEQTIFHKDQSFVSTLWVDQAGVIQKRYLGGRGFTSFAADLAMANAVRDAAILSRLDKKDISLQTSLTSSQSRDEITFRISSVNEDPYKRFPQSSRQKVSSISAIVADLQVTRQEIAGLVTPDISDAESANRQEVDPALKSGPIIQANSGMVQAIVEKWKTADDGKTIQRLAQQVNLELRPLEFTNSVSPASVVLTAKQADCTGYAVVMCAAARAANIPARLASGLTYFTRDGEPAMRYHMWTEVLVDGNWIEIDATQEDGTLPLATIKVTDSNLDDENPYSIILPIFRLIQDIDITIR